jgi:hypothetical protein
MSYFGQCRRLLNELIDTFNHRLYKYAAWHAPINPCHITILPSLQCHTIHHTIHHHSIPNNTLHYTIPNNTLHYHSIYHTIQYYTIAYTTTLYYVTCYIPVVSSLASSVTWLVDRYVSADVTVLPSNFLNWCKTISSLSSKVNKTWKIQV